MTSRIPDIITGHVVPGVINPNIRRKWVTDTPYGPPIKEQPVVQAAPQQPQQPGVAPHQIGDETHSHPDLMSALSKMAVKQTTVQKITDAQPGYRDWR